MRGVQTGTSARPMAPAEVAVAEYVYRTERLRPTRRDYSTVSLPSVVRASLPVEKRARRLPANHGTPVYTPVVGVMFARSPPLLARPPRCQKADSAIAYR